MSEIEAKKIFSENLKLIMEANNKNQSDLIADLGLKSGTISSWVNAQRMPRMNKVQILADYFSVQKSDLLEKKTEDSSAHTKEFIHFTNSCHSAFNSIMNWSEHELLQEYQTIIIRDHLSELLRRYRTVLEKYVYFENYWEGNKDAYIKLYQSRETPLEESDIKELFLKQELEKKLKHADSYLNSLPHHIIIGELQHLRDSKK